VRRAFERNIGHRHARAAPGPFLRNAASDILPASDNQGILSCECQRHFGLSCSGSIPDVQR
jgi:hypothetical protein